MDYSIYLIALSLAIDCFVVSIALASGLKISKVYHYLIPIHFGFFQGGMALIGYFFGNFLIDFFNGFEYLVAFGLLFLVGIKMIYESATNKTYSKISYLMIIILSIATSIDALVIGISFSIIDGLIFQNTLIIGIFSFLLSILGLIIGREIKKYKFQNLEIIGGLVLIGIGIKILIKHFI